MAFLPGGEHLLVAERGGGLKLRDQATGGVIDVEGAPDVRHAGQGGLHDVIPGRLSPTTAPSTSAGCAIIRMAHRASWGGARSTSAAGN